jgi:hypothetical protein
MILDDGALPPRYREEVQRLLSMISTAVDADTARIVGRYSEGVVRGFEVARSLRDSDIEELFVLIEAAIQMRLEYLASQ